MFQVFFETLCIFIYLTVKKLRKLIHFCRSYRKNKSGLLFFLRHGVVVTVVALCTWTRGRSRATVYKRITGQQPFASVGWHWNSD